MSLKIICEKLQEFLLKPYLVVIIGLLETRKNRSLMSFLCVDLKYQLMQPLHIGPTSSYGNSFLSVG